MDGQQFSRRLQEIKDDHRHGATELARMALDLLADYSRELKSETTEEAIEDLSARARELELVRPGMAPVANLVSRWREQLSEHDDQPMEYATKAWSAAAEWSIENTRDAVARTATQVKDLVKDGMTIMTHSMSSTLVGAFRQMPTFEGLHVIVTESRPQNEGYWLCKVLSELGIPNTLVTDAQMALAVQEADLVLIGCDGLLPDHSSVGKVGSHLLALAAREFSVPVYVCCETFKQLADGHSTVELEALDPKELGAPSYPDTTIRNIYNEITPVGLLSAWVNEDGVVELGVEQPEELEEGLTQSA